MRKQETADEWLARQFASGPCEQCGGGADRHTVLVVMGTFYARCDDPCLCQHGNFPGYCAACAGEE